MNDLLRTMPKRGFGMLVLAGVIAAGCSSGHPAARKAQPSPLSPASSSTVPSAAISTAVVHPKQAAVDLGQRMLDKLGLPPGAQPSTAPVPAVLGGGSVPAMGNLERAHRLWTVNEDPRAVYRWLQAHAPRGLKRVETSTGTSAGVRSWGVEDDLSVLPANITTAELQFGISADTSGGAFVRVDTVVGWAEPRPADELVPATDRVVIVTVVHNGGTIGRRVVTSDPKLVQPIVRAFNSLRVSPPDVQTGCPSIGPRSVSYRVGFATSPTADPIVVASIGICSPVVVTVAARTAPALGAFTNSSFGNAVAHVLGLSEPHLG